MEEANIVITAATLTPNPVYTGSSFKISVEIQPADFVIGDDTCRLVDTDGAYISAPDGLIYAFRIQMER